MAVPGRRNGLNDDDDDDNFEDDNALFEEDGLVELVESDTPPHLRDLAAASQSSDLDALRLALGAHFLLNSDPPYSVITFLFLTMSFLP